ncbi:MAG: NYN domain-containing protein [Deltaproteobacteria bacterium]|nr:NYN domain-containing protein [Deltaproteobacteria bacterium]
MGLSDHATKMLLLIDGYNLLHSGRTLVKLNSIELQWERERLIQRLSVYRQARPSEILVVFDGWQAGWSTEKREKKKGIGLIFSRIGEKADEVIKRLIREKGSGAVVVTSDREIAKYAGRLSVPVISSEQFETKLDRTDFRSEEESDESEEERGFKKKGPSRRPSKKEKRLKLALKKL